MSNTSERLKKIISERGVKQVELIERTGISKGALSSYISGRYDPKQDNLYKLAKVLDVNPAWLMGLDVPMEPAAPAGSPAPAAIQAPLRPDEKELLSYYNLLDAEDRAEARGYIKGLVQSEKYRVDSVKGIG